MAEQRQRERESVSERFDRACVSGTFDATIWNRATDKKVGDVNGVFR